MKGDHIYYKGGYKYVLAETYAVATPITGYDVRTRFLILTPDGVLIIMKGYAWDGASGPTFDTSTSMRGTLLHDAFYQLERDEMISQDEREKIDRLLRDTCIEDGMWPCRARAWYRAVRLFGGPAADPSHNHPPMVAP